jgi:hypothetical protein
MMRWLHVCEKTGGIFRPDMVSFRINCASQGFCKVVFPEKRSKTAISHIFSLKKVIFWSKKWFFFGKQVIFFFLFLGLHLSFPALI